MSGISGSVDQISANAFSQFQGLSQGKAIFVRPRTGLDGNSGLSPKRAVQTLVKALSLATANQNDIVYLLAESNTAGSTTDYQSSTLNWNKDGVHLIGVNAMPFLGQRSRVAFLSTYDTASNLFTLSANGCRIEGVEFFAGVAGTTPTGCMQVTGQRNRIRKCQISGMGNAANDIAGAYSLYLNAAAENFFDDCYIGLDTVTLGAAANSQILTASAATRNMFRRCIISTYTNHATNNVFLRCPAASLDRWLIFDDCLFLNPIDAGSTALTQGAVIVSNGGSVLLVGPRTGVFGATDWNATDSGNVTGVNGTVTAATFGLGVDVLR